MTGIVGLDGEEADGSRGRRQEFLAHFLLNIISLIGRDVKGILREFGCFLRIFAR